MLFYLIHIPSANKLLLKVLQCYIILYHSQMLLQLCPASRVYMCCMM